MAAALIENSLSPNNRWLCFPTALFFFSNQPFLSPALPPFFHPHPLGGSDGWYHHGDGSGASRTTLLPAGRLRKVPRSGRRQDVLRLLSARRGDLVGAEGRILIGSFFFFYVWSELCVDLD